MKPLIALLLLAQSLFATVTETSPTPTDKELPLSFESLSQLLAPWREAVRERIEAIPSANYVAADAPIDGGDGWILSGRRARQLIYESSPAGMEPKADERYAAAEKSLLQTHYELKAEGIRLILVIAPDKSDIYPERIAPLPEGILTVSPKSKQLYQRLQHNGVELIELESILRAQKDTDPTPLYMKQDTHWGPRAARIAAETVGKQLKTLNQINKNIIQRPNQTHQWDGDLAENWKRAGNPRPPKETHHCIGVAMKNGKPVQADSNAQVLVLGDSYSTYPYNGYFSFWAFLSYELGYPVAIMDRAGGGNAILKRLQRLPQHKRKNIKAVVLLFTNCSLYEVDFKTIPLTKSPPNYPTMRDVEVTITDGIPPIDPETADYADARWHMKAIVDRGDQSPIEAIISVPIMEKRRLLPAAEWRYGQKLKMDLYDSISETEMGQMVIENTDDQLELPFFYLP